MNNEEKKQILFIFFSLLFKIFNRTLFRESLIHLTLGGNYERKEKLTAVSWNGCKKLQS